MPASFNPPLPLVDHKSVKDRIQGYLLNENILYRISIALNSDLWILNELSFPAIKTSSMSETACISKKNR